MIRILVAAALAAGPAMASAADWALVDLGTLGGANAYAAAVSSGGRIAGCAETAAGEIHAFVWQGGTMSDLGQGCALAVNDQGLVAGRASNGEVVLWTAQGVRSLGFRGEVGDMNGAGTVVGTRESGGARRAFVYSDGAVTELGDPSMPGEATAINSRGQVVGSINGRAFVYESGTLRDLGTLGGATSVARAINDAGEIVGQAANELGQPTAFVHRGSMRPLPGPAYASAVAISASGRIAASGEGTYGYVVSGESVTSLAELPSVVAQGWRKLEPRAMNDRGWIVGTAQNREGDLRAFLLLPASGAKPLRTRGR